MPVDNVIGREYKEDTVYMRIYSDSIPDGWMGLDIGTITQELYAKTIQGAGTVVWNCLLYTSKPVYKRIP